MGASLCALQEVMAVDPQPFKHLVPSLVSILKQAGSLIPFMASLQNQTFMSQLEAQVLQSIRPTLLSMSLDGNPEDVAHIANGSQVVDHRLPKGYDYHKTPAPFIQVGSHLQELECHHHTACCR